MGPRAMHDELMENTRRLEHAALAPLSSEGLAAWLAEVDEAVADLERRWTARTVPPESTKRLISPGPRLAAVCARDPAPIGAIAYEPGLWWETGAGKRTAGLLIFHDFAVVAVSLRF